MPPPSTIDARQVDPVVDARTPRLRLALACVMVAVAYYAGAKAGFILTPKTQPVSTLWPPNAILMGALLLAPARVWGILLLAALPAHLAVELGSGVPFGMVLSWFVSNSAEALIGAAIVRRFIKPPVQFDTFRNVGIFVVGAALGAPFASSFLDAAFVQWNAWGTAGYWEVWHVRFFSNVLTILIIVPVIVSWDHRSLQALRAITARRALEAGLLVSTLLVVSTIVFVRPALGAHVTVALLAAPLPFLLWAALRFGPAGASGCLLIVAVLSVWGAIHGQGPFATYPIADYVLSLQLFLIVTYIPIFALTAAIRECVSAEEVARRSEERLTLSLSAAQVGAWDWNIVGGHPTGSRSTNGLFGQPATNGATHGKIDHPAFLDTVNTDDRLIVLDGISDAIEYSKPYEVEFRTAGSNGAVRWLLSKGTVVRDVTGRPIRMVGVNADITDRKRAEDVLRQEAMREESDARLRALADAMPQIAFTARPDGMIDYFNGKWYEFTGMPRDQVIDESWVNVIHPVDRNGCVESWHQDVSMGRPHEHEGRFWNARTSRYRWFLARALPVRDESGAIIRWYGTATDIEDQKRTEHALRESEASLRTLRSELEYRVSERTLALKRSNETLHEEIDTRVRIERALRASEERFAKAFRASLDAISISHHPDAHIVEINDRHEAIFGFARDEVIGRTVDELEIFAHQKDRKRFLRLMKSHGNVHELELDMRHKNGTLLRAVLSAETVEVGGDPCLIMMVRDVTERKNADRKIAEQQRELAHLGRVAMLGELSGALAHELNQPLAAILANGRAGERLLTRGDVDQTELRAILDDIVSDGRRAGEVIRRVRAMLRKDEAELQPIAPNDVVTDVLELAHSDLIQRGVIVSTDLAPSLPYVLADGVQLQQVMLNLIVNACDAMTEYPPDERILTISTGKIGTTVRVSVTDNGTGLTSERLETVFQPFVTSKRHGLGLGLTICRSIVEAHGGGMQAANNVGRGATFHVVLPASSEQGRPTAIAPAESEPAAL